MKKSYLVIIFGIIIAAGILVYFLKPWPGQKPQEAASNKATVKAATNSGDQHNTGGAKSAARAENPRTRMKKRPLQ